MTDPARIPVQDLPPGAVRRAGPWAVGNRDGAPFAVSRACRHQLADLSKGTIDADGCLVCPWHQSRFDVETGEMVEGPKGLLGYHGRTPRYAKLVMAYANVLKLRVRAVARQGEEYVVDATPPPGADRSAGA